MNHEPNSQSHPDPEGCTEAQAERQGREKEVNGEQRAPIWIFLGVVITGWFILVTLLARQ